MNRKDQMGEMKSEMRQKTSQFMLYYQRLMKEKQIQKQKIKNNVMLQIMSNRQKSQSIASNAMSQRESIRTEKINYKDMFNEPKVSDAFRKHDRRDSSKQLQSETDKHHQQNKQQQLGRSYSMPYTQQEFTNGEEHHLEQQQNLKESPKNQLAQITFKNKIIPQISLKADNDSINNKKMAQYITFRDSRTIVNPPIPISSKRKSSQQHPSSSEQEKQQKIEREPIDEEYENGGKGVFLTVNDSQVFEDEDDEKSNKNIAFDIMIQKSDVFTQNLQQMRKKKIEQLDKKRKQRIQQNKKNNVEKQLSKGKHQGSIEKKNQNVGNNGSQDEDNEKQNQKKLKPNKALPKKTQNSSLHDLASQLSQVKPQDIRSTYQNQKRKNINPKEERAQSPNTNTPKTTFTSKNKLIPKSNIFIGDSPMRDKSASRLHQAKDKNLKTAFNKQSNKKLMITAITYVCLPGELNRKQREKLIEVIENQGEQFVIFLFKQYSRKVVKGIYTLDLYQNKVNKIYGDKAPNELFSEQVQEFYRFDSGSREFKKLDGCKSFSLAVHAVDLK